MASGFRAPLFATLALALTAMPAHAIDDSSTVRLSAWQADARNELRGRTQFLGSDYRFEETFDFGSDVLPRLDGELRLGERHRLVFNYFDYDSERAAALDEPISFDAITIPAGSFAVGDTEFRLAGLAYDFAVVETPTVSVGVQLGVQHARLEGRLFAQAGTGTYSESGEESGVLPVVGLRAAFASADAWRVTVQGQRFDAAWANLDGVRGGLTRASAVVEYRFTERFGVHAGYDYVRLGAQDEDGDGLIGLDQRLAGPMAGVTVAF